MYLLELYNILRVRVSLTGCARHAAILLYVYVYGTDSGPISTVRMVYLSCWCGRDAIIIMEVQPCICTVAILVLLGYAH